MKYLYAFAIAGFSSLGLSAQKHSLHMSDDSSRTIVLKEIRVSSRIRNTQQHLVDYYRTNQAATLEEILARLPEASLIRRGAYGMEPAIRSFSAAQVNVLVDGMRIHGACTDKMDPATIYIEPINLENLQVLTGATGFLSGSATGGTVHLKMAEPELNSLHKFSGTVNSGYQSVSRGFIQSASLNFAPHDHWALLATGTYRSNQNYKGGNRETVPFSQFEKVNYSLSASYKISRRTQLKANLLGDDGWNIGYPALPMDVGYAAARIAAISIRQENMTDKLLSWQLKLYSNRVSHSMDDTHRPNVPMHMDMPGISKTSGMVAEAEIKRSGTQRFMVRADATTTFLKASMTMYQAGQQPMYMLTWPDNRRNHAGLSASWLVQTDSTLKLQINGRAEISGYQLTTDEAKQQISILDYHSPNRTDLLKSLAMQIQKKWHRSFLLTAALSYSERAPSASELYGFWLYNSHDGYDYIGNPELKTEKALQAELNVAFQHRRSRIQVSIFASELPHYISAVADPVYSAMTIGAHGVKRYINLNRAFITGAEGSIFVPATALLTAVSTVRFTAGTDAKGEPLPFIAPLKNMTSLRFAPGSVSLMLEAESAVTQKRFQPDAREDGTPGYFLLHFRFRVQTSIAENIIDLQGGIENMFDRKYHEHLDWGNFPRPGRNFYLQAKITF